MLLKLLFRKKLMIIFGKKQINIRELIKISREQLWKTPMHAKNLIFHKYNIEFEHGRREL